MRPRNFWGKSRNTYSRENVGHLQRERQHPMSILMFFPLILEKVMFFLSLADHSPGWLPHIPPTSSGTFYHLFPGIFNTSFTTDFLTNKDSLVFLKILQIISPKLQLFRHDHFCLLHVKKLKVKYICFIYVYYTYISLCIIYILKLLIFQNKMFLRETS